jgi:hypothetical protein
MQQSRARTRTVGLALCAAISLAGFSSISAFAQDNNTTDPGVRCAAKVGPGQYEFYLPGERATDVNGNKWVCGPDGQWFRDYSALTIGGTKLGNIGTKIPTGAISTTTSARVS